MVNYAMWKTEFNFANDMNIYSRQYFSYDIQHEIFCKYSNDIISQFRAFVQNLNINLDEISVKYCIYNEPNQASLEALNKLKQAAMYSLFFQKIEEFIHIYSQGKIFPSSRDSYEFNKEVGIWAFVFMRTKLHPQIWRN